MSDRSEDMGNPSQGYSQDTRTKMDQLIERLRSDTQFRDQVKGDPVNALTQAGLPQDAVGDFLHHVGGGADAEVAGYRMCSMTCISASCTNEVTICRISG